MKKFSSIILCFLFLITCGLTGCAGFSINRVKYYNDVVASVGDTNITRYELLSAYSSYGESYYVQQLGQEESAALESTLKLLMDRESLYQYAKTQSALKPTAYQVNSAIETMYSSIDSQMETYVKQAKRILNVKIEDDDSSSDSETAYKYSDYDTVLKGKRAKLETKVVNGVSVDQIVYVEDDEPAFDCVLGAGRETALTDFTAESTLQLIIDSYFDKFYKSLENEEKQDAIYNKCISLMASDLISGEKYLRDKNGKAYNTVTKDLINRYFKKNFDAQIKSQYLTNIRTDYLTNHTEELSIDALLERYVELVQTSYNKYANFSDDYKSAMKDAGTKADSILYHPTTDAQFGYFIHCLIKFDDTDDNNNNQKADIAVLDKLLEANQISDEEYRARYDTIVSKTTAQERDLKTGLIKEDSNYTLAQILNEYRNVSDMDEFIQFMFRFTEDTATLSAGMPYVVGTDGNSAMETAFTDEAVRLMTEGKPGDMTPATINTDSDKGATMCITSYGIHFLYYIGDVNMNDVPFGSINTAYIANANKDGNDYNLYKMELNPLTHQTYFDMLFDAVYPASSSEETYADSTGYTARENQIIQETRENKPAKIYETKLKGTKTSN